MVWHARLNLNYQVENQRCVARYDHSGPLRILQSLYPEGDSICHNVLVHPPGGLVGGDTLELHVKMGPGVHGLVTTPGATRFYRSDGPQAVQTTRLQLDEGARLEWLPLEALCYDACNAVNRLQLDLAPGAQCLGWDVTALGLPLANLPFVSGCLEQQLEIPGVWLERGRVSANDARLMDGPTGLAGHRCVATLFFASGTPWSRADKEALLDTARETLSAHSLASTAGVTSPNSRTLVLRVLAPTVEPAMQLLRAVRKGWRAHAWQLHGHDPRIWAM
ncbi:MAG: urease accessory protein UreD [Rhodoferax sp.]|uniref:urease accessory protein UreD n=1 Tax=Rhodoferax sp. TaxID=50421 RepID=UPI002ACEEAE6|nr:urease accessory protein UreD [Rhodoferax sp.]MDZ7893197.1 urease accessory protein UreD [Rhodoferax sp.]